MIHVPRRENWWKTCGYKKQENSARKAGFQKWTHESEEVGPLPTPPTSEDISIFFFDYRAYGWLELIGIVAKHLIDKMR